MSGYPRTQEPTSCVACATVKPAQEFSSNGRRRNGLNRDCKSCVEANRRNSTRSRPAPNPLHSTWVNMHYRCSNPKSVGFKHYGGRGIKVCDRWSGPAGFANFVEDMGPFRPPAHSIDRIDNDGNYSPENCRWADGVTQQNNKVRRQRT